MLCDYNLYDIRCAANVPGSLAREDKPSPGNVLAVVKGRSRIMYTQLENTKEVYFSLTLEGSLLFFGFFTRCYAYAFASYMNNNRELYEYSSSKQSKLLSHVWDPILVFLIS